MNICLFNDLQLNLLLDKLSIEANRGIIILGDFNPS